MFQITVPFLSVMLYETEPGSMHTVVLLCKPTPLICPDTQNTLSM